jgi:hypothetical protein
VPKFLVNKDGSLGARNGIYCGGLEHKMGIKANATAQIVLDGAIGTMVGQPNKGMQGMFVMMNAARLGVGNQSLGLTEVAYQNALAYAKDRIQMRSLSGPKAKDKPADPIIVHPDVRKMLLTAKAYAEGGRALAIFCSVLLEKSHYHPDEKVRKDSDEMLSLLTPIVKAFLTDNGWQATTMCQQVFGGHGYIKEWGMEQFVRDARINMIYEGTNTIQSLDLLGRKVLGNNGATLKKFGKLVGALVAEEGVNEKMAEFITRSRCWASRSPNSPPKSDSRVSRTPMRWALPRWTTCAWPGTWCLATSLPAWPRWRCARSPQATPTRSIPPSCRRRASTSPSCSRRRRR